MMRFRRLMTLGLPIKVWEVGLINRGVFSWELHQAFLKPAQAAGLENFTTLNLVSAREFGNRIGGPECNSCPIFQAHHLFLEEIQIIQYLSVYGAKVE
jgi:hypothetical protein